MKTVATIALTLTLVGFGCDRAPPPVAGPPPSREVEIVQVSPKDLPVEFEFVGRTASSQRVEIRARVSGYLDSIEYAEGEFVEEGQVLFRIDPAPFESRLRAASAELSQQQARLENAQALLDRIEPLVAADAVAEKELDDARGRKLEAAAAVEAASAGVFDAELNLGYATITAPVSGLTGEATQREGAYISFGTAPLTYVARVDPIWVEFSITETQILRGVRRQSSGVVRYPENEEFDVAIELSDGTEHAETGRISFSDASVSTETGAVLVRAEIPNPEQTLRPGQYVRVFVRGAFRPDAITVPKRAVREGPKGAFVWVVNAEGAAEQRPITLGPWNGDDWVVETGLRADDRVVVNGSVALRPGTPLSITRILGAGSTPPAADSTEGGTP